MGNRPWADERDMHPCAEFLCSVLGATVGIYGFPGWIIVALGANQTAVMLSCLAFGAGFGIYMVWQDLCGIFKRCHIRYFLKLGKHLWLMLREIAHNPHIAQKRS